MRNADYSLAGRKAAFPLMEDRALSPVFAEEGISQEDLQLIDSFAGLHKAERKTVLNMVRHMLLGKSQSLSK